MPGRKKLFGCEEKAVKPVEIEEVDGVTYNYYSCPLQFIAPNVWEFFKLYKYAKDFPGGMPHYEDTCPRFIQAYQYFEAQKALATKKV